MPVLKYASVDDYILKIDKALAGRDMDIARLSESILSLKKSGRTLFTIGNGGSLAVAQHFAQDLLKACGVKAICLNDPSVITAYSNDLGFRYSSFEPLRLLSVPGDAAIIFSVSGMSRNYIEVFSDKKIPIFSVTGKDGGFVLSKSDVGIHIDSSDYQVCETAFQIVCDIVCNNIMAVSDE